MKSEHRHELKTNELAEWLANFPQWAKENLRMIIYVAILIVVVAGAYIWKHYQKDVVAINEKLQFTKLITELTQNRIQSVKAASQGADYSYTLIQTANKLQSFALAAKDENLAALALIKRGEALRTELHYRAGKIEPQNLKDQIAKAKAAYGQALEKAQQVPSLKAEAMFGLGLCEEELGDFEKAKEMYQQIEQDSELEGTTAAASAAHRLRVMDDYKQKIVFLEPPIVPEALPETFEGMTMPELEGMPAVAEQAFPNLPAGE